jgi:hypothetical protein
LEINTSTVAQPIPDYVVSATPITWGTSGSANWCSFVDGVLRTSKNGTAAANASIAATPTMAGCNDPTAYGPAQ